MVETKVITAKEKVYAAIGHVLEHAEEGSHGAFYLTDVLDLEDEDDGNEPVIPPFSESDIDIDDPLCGQVLTEKLPHKILLDALGYTIVEINSKGGEGGGGDRYEQILAIIPKEHFSEYVGLLGDVIKTVEFINLHKLEVLTFSTWYASYEGIAWDDGELTTGELAWEPVFITK